MTGEASPAVRATVRIEPLGISITVEANENIMAAAERQGLKWPTLCRGNAQCGFCFMEIISSTETLASPEEREIRALKLAPTPASAKLVRLACQLKPTGNLVVERNGVKHANQSNGQSKGQSAGRSKPAKHKMEAKNAEQS